MKQEIIRINLGGVNCYLGKEGDKFILFDTGGHLIMDNPFNNRLELLLEELDKVGCCCGNLKLIVLTHGDNDHVANAAFLRDKYQAPIAIHPNDASLVENPTLDLAMKNFQFKSPVLRIASFILKKRIKKVMMKTLDDFKVFKPDILLREGDNLLKYGFNAEIIHIPGHTDGSIGILTASGEMIIGDTLGNLKSPGAAQNAADFRALNVSIKRIKNMNIRRFYPGHGEPFSSF